MPNKSIIPYEIYVDGSAKGNDAAHRLGAWAYAILYDGDMIRKDAGGVRDTTNQRMELQAVIEAIKGARELSKDDPGAIYKIYSDSAYLVNCYHQGWYVGWEKNGWRNAAKKEVANRELWEQILPYFKSKSWHFYKTKGHADDYYNNYVDAMAQKESEKLKHTTR